MLFEVLGSTMLYVNYVLFGSPPLEPPEVAKYVELANETFYNVVAIMNWHKREVVLNSTDGDVILKVDCKKLGTVFIAEMELDIEAVELFNILWYNSEAASDWNPYITSIEKLIDINNQTMITYQTIGTDAYLLPRDFVNLNSFREIEGAYYITYQSIEFPGKPYRSGYVRGENGPSGSVIRSEQNATNLSWIFNTDMKMHWMPKSIMDSMYPAVIENYLKYLRRYIGEYSNNRKLELENLHNLVGKWLRYYREPTK